MLTCRERKLLDPLSISDCPSIAAGKLNLIQIQAGGLGVSHIVSSFCNLTASDTYNLRCRCNNDTNLSGLEYCKLAPLHVNMGHSPLSVVK